MPYHKAGTHYTYDKTGNLADAAEIENDHENEDCQQPSCKEEEVLRLQALELYRPTYTLVDFKLLVSDKTFLELCVLVKIDLNL